MGQFQFRDNSVHLDIAGQAFTIPGTVEYAQKLRDFGAEAQRRAQELSAREDAAEALEEGIRFIWDALDGILGPGAAQKIFAGREPTLYDAIDVLLYINEEFAAFQRGKQEQYSGVMQQYSPNRAQRRAAKPMPKPAAQPDLNAIIQNPAVLSAMARLLENARADESAD